MNNCERNNRELPLGKHYSTNCYRQYHWGMLKVLGGRMVKHRSRIFSISKMPPRILNNLENYQKPTSYTLLIGCVGKDVTFEMYAFHEK